MDHFARQKDIMLHYANGSLTDNFFITEREDSIISGTKAGWEKRRKKMEYNAEGKSVFHAEIGAKGGKSPHERILSKDPKFASEIGKKGAAARKKKREDKVK